MRKILTVLAALASLFVRGEVALIELGPARAHLAPALHAFVDGYLTDPKVAAQ